VSPVLSPNDRTAYTAGFAQAIEKDTGLPSWLTSVRRTAFDAFLDQGWPTTKQEDWRFTDVTPITRLALLPPPAGKPQFAKDDFATDLLGLGGDSARRLLFVDGRYHSGGANGRPLPDDLCAIPLASALADNTGTVGQVLGHHLRGQNAFVALNTAFMTDGAFVRIPAGFTSEAPIFLVYLASIEGSASFPRTVVWAGANSQATIVEIHLGADHRSTLATPATLASAVTEILLEPGAHIAHHGVQKASPAGCHIGHLAVTQKAGSVFSGSNLALAGRMVRNDVHVLLAEEGCTCNLDGLYLAAGASHIDNHTTVDHRAPRSTSREIYKGVVGDRSRAVFSGRIVVRPNAQQTDARQTNRNIVLCDGAVVHSKPHLEIFANDVKCSHGATTGRLNPDALFYLRSRGIGEKEANQLLIRAFMLEGLDCIAQTGLRAELENVLVKRIEDLSSAGGFA
jgi:Fe-S cluster assembly protein SufD